MTDVGTKFGSNITATVAPACSKFATETATEVVDADRKALPITASRAQWVSFTASDALTDSLGALGVVGTTLEKEYAPVGCLVLLLGVVVVVVVAYLAYAVEPRMLPIQPIQSPSIPGSHTRWTVGDVGSIDAVVMRA